MRGETEMNWMLVVFDANWKNRMEYKIYGSVVEAFTKGNDLVRSKGNSFQHYRVEPLFN